uniref:Uncharacterized protein n=1 Tax=viral metagenome TaxID=1070528 RepID=A0A6M3M1F4_9ZZZZ
MTQVSETPECDKLNARTGDWNSIFPFIEWLQENRMCIAVWRDPDASYTNDFTGETGTIEEMAEHLLTHPYPYGQPIENLLYKYFGVDPEKLERERRGLLEAIR